MILELSPEEGNEATFSSSDTRMERVDGWVVLLSKNGKERKSRLLGIDF